MHLRVAMRAGLDGRRRLRDNDIACAVFLALVRLGVAAIIAGAISD